MNQLRRLNSEQLGILTWSLGNLDLPYVNTAKDLWANIESHLMNESVLASLEPIGITSICYGLQRSSNGSEKLWAAISDVVIKKA